MSISNALANALTGLTASSRKAEIVSQNVANVMTEGYARRELLLSSKSIGGDGAGVQIDGVARVLNAVVLQDKRLADAAAGNASTRADFYNRLEQSVGDPEDADSLSVKLTSLETALVEAASNPDVTARLSSVLSAAKDITNHLNSVSDQLSQMRMDADSEISAQVDFLNSSLERVDELNETILAQTVAGHDATSLMDERQRIVDTISEIVPVRQIDRDNNQISLFTTGGAILLEGNAVEIGFSATGYITADMTQESGALSGLTINGLDISTADEGRLGGGTLGALFAIRDELAVDAQSQLDAIARNLIERFEDNSVDPTLGVGDPGFFTDAGEALDTADEIVLQDASQ